MNNAPHIAAPGFIRTADGRVKGDLIEFIEEPA